MRIIGGTRAGRTIVAPSGHSTRPTSDRVREAIFNRIEHADLPGLCDGGALSGPVLDLYAGSGGLGLEALSRGAPRCDFVDATPAACATVERNIETLRFGPTARVHKQRVEVFLRRARPGYTLLFADPPYADGSLLDDVLAIVHDKALLAAGALVVLEHAPSPAPRREQPGLVFVDERAYGQTVVSWFTAARHGTRSDA